ncbi:hypothetical protein QBC43DRAFT_326494 [Cladorrhinum sp. PSN259]|nr:hypothetical protein QBC43DRAFT_326494 [Cladorrhinum sp. PSN259]
MEIAWVFCFFFLFYFGFFLSILSGYNFLERGLYLFCSGLLTGVVFFGRGKKKYADESLCSAGG